MERHEKKHWRIALSAIMLTVGMAGCFWLSHMLCSWIFSLTETPPAP